MPNNTVVSTVLAYV